MGHKNQTDIDAWLDFAVSDFETARFLYDHQHPKQLEIICYHCQQAAEKAIKALFVRYDLPGGIPRKHDLSFLLNQLQSKTDISSDLRRRADILSVYGVISRYPNEISVDEEHAKDAVQCAEVILTWVKEKSE